MAPVYGESLIKLTVIGNMNRIQKINYIYDNHFGQWLSERRKVDEELSDKQGMFCMCGRLATGLHENNCKRFQNKINNETIKRLSYLLPKNENKKTVADDRA